MKDFISRDVGDRLPAIQSASNVSNGNEILSRIASCRSKLRKHENSHCVRFMDIRMRNDPKTKPSPECPHTLDILKNPNSGFQARKYVKIHRVEADARGRATAGDNKSSDSTQALIEVDNKECRRQDEYSVSKLVRSLSNLSQQTQDSVISAKTVQRGQARFLDLHTNSSTHDDVHHSKPRARSHTYATSRVQSRRVGRLKHRATAIELTAQTRLKANKMSHPELPSWRQARSPLELFSSSIRLVRTICTVSMLMKHYAINCADVTSLLEQANSGRKPPTSSSPEPGADRRVNRKPFTFNRHIYSTENCLHFPLWAQIICCKLPHHRTMQEKDRLCSFLRGIKIFSTLSLKKQMLVAETVAYNVYDKMRVILLQNRKAECFYIILSGSAIVDISMVDKNTGVQVTHTVNRLVQDDIFGETALIYNESRKATIVSHSQIEVLLIDNETFQKTFTKPLRRALEEKQDFLRRAPQFEGVSNTRLRILSYDAKAKYYSPQKIIDDNLNASMFIYYVMSGSVDSIYYVSEDRVTKRGSLLYNSQGLYSDLLRRNIGFLGGNRIDSPNSCNMSIIYPARKNSREEAKVLLLSRGATLLRIPKQSVVEMMDEVLRKRGGINDPHRLPEIKALTAAELIKEAQMARAWLEYRNALSQNCTSKRARQTKLPKLK